MTSSMTVTSAGLASTLPSATSPTASPEKHQTTTSPSGTQSEARCWFPSVSMPSFSFANGVVNAAVYGAVVACAMNSFAPAYAVSVLTGAAACSAAKLAQNLLADKVNSIASLLIGSALATTVVCFSSFTACTLSTLSVPLTFFGFTALSASISHALQMVANYNFSAKSLT